MQMSSAGAGRLIITADDWGYSPRYNAGIVEAMRSGAIDAVSALVLRPECDPAPLLEAGVEVGLHLELKLPAAGGYEELMGAPRIQAEGFERLFGRPPAYIDGHHHCHASLPSATAVEDLALELAVPVRPVGEDHRYRLSERGIASPDRAIGRMDDREPVMPKVLAKALLSGALPWGITEWIVHPGHSDPEAGSGYDRGREEDLALLLRLAEDESLSSLRGTHQATLGVPVR
jgi:predicted glycoside hydrolase/deacetylase ChbG (UPF0249 family)